MEEKKKLLIVEDEDDLCKVLKVRAEAAGYETFVSTDGEDVLEKVIRQNPDLIVLDLMMPKMDGFEFCCRVKKMPDFQDIPIVVLSALSEEKDKERAINCGAAAYFVKPFDLDVLVKKIKSYIDV